MSDKTKPKTAEEVLADMWEYFTTPGMNCGAPYPKRHETVFEKLKEREDLWSTQLATARAEGTRNEQALERLRSNIERSLAEDKTGWRGVCAVDLNAEASPELGKPSKDGRVLTVPEGE